MMPVNFASVMVFKHSEEFRNRRHFSSITAICRISNILQRLTVHCVSLGAKGVKRSVKMWTTNFLRVFQKYFVEYERSAVKNSVHTNVTVYFD